MTQQQQLPTQTYEPMPPLPPHAPVQHAVPLTKRVWFLPALLVAALFVGGAAASSFHAVATTTKAANCKVAFEHADTVLDAAGNSIVLLGDGMEAAASFDAGALEDLVPKLEEENSRIDAVTEDFKTARSLCEG